MKSTTTILTLGLAALTMANPVANPSSVADPVASPVADPQVTPPPVQTPNCRTCDAYYTKCRSSWGCWFNPTACETSCRLDTCRMWDGYCKNNCGYTGC